MKHGGPGTAVCVGVHYAADELTVEVADAGGAPGEPGAEGGAGAEGGNGEGQGLAGMRARVAMLGGELAAGPRAGAGFRVRARLPLTLAESLR
jgi:signal transduction histidine kinase